MHSKSEYVPTSSDSVGTDVIEKLWPLTASKYAAAATSENTRRAYRSDIAHFIAWGGSLPATTAMIIEYLEDHAQTLSVRTLKRRIATLNEAHRLLGLDSPADCSAVRKITKGIARTVGKPVKKAPPLLLDHAFQLIKGLDGSPGGIRDKAMILLGWSVFFRRSEIVALDVTDLNFLKDRIVITRPRGKTNQERSGQKVAVPKIDGPACPYQAVKDWIKLSGFKEGPLFRRVYKGGAIKAEPTPLTGHMVSEMLKKRCQNSGVDGALLFSGHSLRRGGITEAYSSNENESDIQKTSDHKSLMQLRTYRDDAAALAGRQASTTFLEALSDKLAQPAE